MQRRLRLAAGLVAMIAHGALTVRATTYGLMKIPAPMMPPMTSIVASKAPRRRASCVSVTIGWVWAVRLCVACSVR